MSPEGSTILGSGKLQELEKACHWGCALEDSTGTNLLSPPHPPFPGYCDVLGGFAPPHLACCDELKPLKMGANPSLSRFS